MYKKIQFESETFISGGLCNTIEIEVLIYPTAEDDADWEVYSIHDVTENKSREYEEFSPAEQAKIDRLAQEVTNENTHEAYHEMMRERAEWRAESYKDGSYDD